MQPAQDKVAAFIGAGTSVALAGMTWLQALEVAVRIGAGVMAIIAGAVTTYYTIKRNRGRSS